MSARFNSLVSATAVAAILALAAPVFGGAESAVAGGKKADRLPVAATVVNVCDDSILGSIKDECVQQVVEAATIQPIKTTTIEWRDEENGVSTLMRAPALDMAVAPAPTKTK